MSLNIEASDCNNVEIRERIANGFLDYQLDSRDIERMLPVSFGNYDLVPDVFGRNSRCCRLPHFVPLLLV